jgi:protein disulfide-isomerase A1
MQVLAYTGNEDGRKFIFDGEVTVAKIKVFFSLLHWTLLVLLPRYVICMNAFFFHSMRFKSNVLTKFQIFILSQAFGEDFLEDKLKPFFKSDPVPETVSYLIWQPLIMFC